MPFPVAAMAGIAAGGALLGGLAGGQRQNTTQETQRIVAPESQLGKLAAGLSEEQLKELQKLIGAGPGQQDVAAGVASQRSLADMLGQYAQGGYQPNAADLEQARSFTQSMFAPQQEQMRQAFQDQQMYGNRQAARMGRAGNDPVLMNKLAQEQTRQQSMLGAQQQQYFSQYAQQIPQQRLGYTQQLAQVQSGLASQAMANRQALLSAGQQALAQDQNFRVGTASSITSQQSGGGLGGMLTGALGGAGMGLGVASLFGGK